MKYIVVLCISLGAVLLYLLSSASANTAAFSQHYTLLLVLNGLLAVGLLGLIAYQLWTLRRKLKAQVFGSKLTLRMLWMFALMAVLPGVVVYGVSVRFQTKAIESWFDVRVDSALEGGLSLGRSALDNLLVELSKKGGSMALALTDYPTSAHLTMLNSLREQMGVQEAALMTSRGSVIVFSSSERSGFMPDIPPAAVLRQVRSQSSYSAIELLPEKGLYLRVVVPVNVSSLSEDMRVLQLLQPVPKRLAQDAEAVQSAYRDYQELSLSRQGLKKIFTLTLTLALLLALLSAIALAFVLSQRLSAPLEILAEGTRAIAKGDFSQRHPVRSRDELGALMQSFNSMTHQLAEARQTAEYNQEQLKAAKAYLESILAHLSSGVLAFDERYYLRTANLSAEQILGTELAALRGLKLFDWGTRDKTLQPFAQALSEQFQRSGVREWQQQIDYAGKSGSQVLLVRGTCLPPGIDNGYVAVFDDVTELLQAQRDAAWGEVARRLAHEIKNPLTPIQLSAERLEHKLAAKLEEGDADILKRATRTIVNQVTALKSMVNAFSEYARAPQLHLQTVDLNRLVREVLALYESHGTAIRLNLAPQLPGVRGDMTLLRQVLHNLLQNAQDVLSETAQPEIEVETKEEGAWVRLSIRDNGSGFPEELMSRLFEPYVTTKQKGTGLGLAIVKKIVEEHNGMIRIENTQPQGACVSVLLPREEADQ